MRLYLIDGSGYIHRAFYGIRPLSTADGTPVNAVYGVAKMLLNLLSSEEPDAICVCYDMKGPTFRHELYADYKANRQAPPEDLVAQFPLVRELIAAMGLFSWERPGYEADDLLGTLAAAGQKAGYQVVVVSGDKDLAQLVGPGIELIDPTSGNHYTDGKIIEKLGVYPQQVVDYLALLGDSSDNIPGVPKIGAKTAARLLAEYGNLDAILQNAAAITPPSVQKSLLENKEQALLSRTLATICHTVPDVPPFPAMTFKGLAFATLLPFLQKMEMRDLASRVKASAMEAERLEFERQMDFPETQEEEPPPAAPEIDEKVNIITTKSALNELATTMEAAETLVIEAGLAGMNAKKSLLLGLALKPDNGAPAYIPLNHSYLGMPEQLALPVVLDKLLPIIKNKKLVGQYITRAIWTFMKIGAGKLPIFSGDTMLAAYLLDPENHGIGLEHLMHVYLGREFHFEQFFGQKPGKAELSDMAVENCAAYFGTRASAIAALHEILLKKLEHSGMLKLYHEIELPLTTLLTQMEWDGVKIDQDALLDFGRHLKEQIAGINSEINALLPAGTELNISSPKQLSTYLFETLRLPHQKKRSTGYATDQETLETLALLHPLPKLVLEHRQLSKLESTYVDAILKVLDKNGRVHTTFNQARTATGRLSSSDPNLQNIPVRSPLGREIRKAFIAAPGSTLLSADYSQIELRLLAHFSRDPAFTLAYREGADIHERTAKELFGNSTPELRQRAKTINFGIIYGLSAFRLGQDLGISSREAKEYIDGYFGRYPGIRRFMDETLKEARRLGYVTTLFGRRRYLPELLSQNGNMRNQAERMAINTTIQGSAADLIKVAMLRLDRALKAANLSSRIILQVHDELVLEVLDAERLDVLESTVTAMEDAVTLEVPLKVEAHFGDNWSKAH